VSERSLEQRVARLERLLKPPQNPNAAISFGERVRRLRENSGLTQSELCSMALISKGFLSDMENDKRMPSADTLHGLAKALGVSMDFLWTGFITDRP
jgi:transcriptional regulator with XRE-family HTH domain